MTDTQVTRRTLLQALAWGGTATVVGSSAACSQEEAGSSSDSEAANTLEWWDYVTEDEAGPIKAMIASYEAEHPNVRINRRSIPYAEIKRILLQSAAAGDLPDITILNSPDHQQFAELGIAEDLTNRVAEWGNADLYRDAPWASVRWEDKVYGIPQGLDCLAMWYDRGLFEEHGLTPPETWEELKSVGKELTGPDRYGLAYAAPNDQSAVFQWLPALWQAGGDLDVLNGEAANRALTLWVDLVNEGVASQQVLNWRQADIGNEFVNRRAAMMINGPWELPRVKAEAPPDLDWAIALLPRDVMAATVSGGENYLIVKDGNVDLAWDFVQWSQQPENLIEYLEADGLLPTRSDITDDPVFSDPALQIFTEQSEVAIPRAYGANYPEIAEAVVQAIQGAISGDTAVEAALAKAATAIDPLLLETMPTELVSR